jgi:putative copper resistance protein D
VDTSLAVIRTVHFASTAMTAGALIFLAVVAGPVLRGAGARNAENAPRTQTLRIVWAVFALTVLSGLAWLLIESAAMSGRPLPEALADGVVLVVLSKTQFGMVSTIRLAFAILLAVSLIAVGARSCVRFVPAIVAACLVAAIAWTGHAAGTIGPLGSLHLAADAMHLLAASAWIGGLLPLVLLLRWTAQHDDQQHASIAWQAASRFSVLGVISVGTLLATGLVNSWILIGSFRGLVATHYGQLISVKVLLFAAMVSVAAVNRMRLTPQLVEPAGSPLQLAAVRQLTRNIAIEIAVGLSIFALVGLLGTLHPAIHLVPA